jgi:hypothetical protein
MHPKPFRDERHPDHEQEAERQHHDGRIVVDEAG